jgi:hypothetical protein
MGNDIKKCEDRGIDVNGDINEHKAICDKKQNTPDMYFHPGELIYVRSRKNGYKSSKDDTIAQRQWTCCGRWANDTETRGCTKRT